MDKKVVVAFIFAIIGLAVLTSGCTQQSQNTTQNNTVQNLTQNNTVQENTNLSGAIKDYDATIIQKGPSTTQKRGTSVTIHYTVTNKGKKTIYNAEVGAQDFDRYIGTLKPGQTKKFTYTLYIPTDEDLAYMYEGGNVELTSPLMVGGIGLSFTDGKGILHGVESNSIEIKFK